MLNTVLFDLDGTIVPIDTDDFINEYFKSIAAKIANIINPKIFIKSLYDSTMEMINNLDEKITNEKVFYKSFFKKIDISTDIIMNLFDDFYKNEYLLLKKLIKPNDYIPEIIELLKRKGYNIILATNPIFPLVALEHRAEWAGVNPRSFSFITSYETMHFCKPYINYYNEILAKINKQPSECLMIGNDIDEDMVSDKLGFDTFLLTDHLINKNNANINNYKNGSYEDLYKFIKSLPAV